MTIDQLTEILVYLGFVKTGKLIAPNFRCWRYYLYSDAGLRIVVTRNNGEIFHTNNREWTFSLKRIKSEDLFKMLDYYFDEDKESIYSPKLTINKDESYESFRTILPNIFHDFKILIHKLFE